MTDTMLVSHIQRGSCLDGPGIRTTVFLKGCPLQCPWCFNAESLRYEPELRFVPQFCPGLEECGLCLPVCENKAIIKGCHKPVLRRKDCNACGKCALICPSGALSMIGMEMNVEEILAIVKKDALFYRISGGGLSLSGGEPLIKPFSACQILKKAKEADIHTAIETSGWFDLDNPHTRNALQNCNLLIFELGHLSGHKYQEFKGVDNFRILENLHRLGGEFGQLPILLRTTIIAGFNDDPQSIRALALYGASHPTIIGHELFPCVEFGDVKYLQMGKNPRNSSIFVPAPGIVGKLELVVAECRNGIHKNLL